MSVDTSVSPYFDDFEPTKNFVKVLYKPGVAVQARELTQSQSILQNQIRSVGGYLFKDGAKVSGPKPSVNLDARTIRLKTVNAQNFAINVQNFLNTYVKADNSDVLGYVEFVYNADEPEIGNPPSVVISLKKYNSTNNGMFAENTEIKFYNSYSDALNNLTPDYTAVTAADITKNATSTLSTFSKIVTLASPNNLIEVGDELSHPSLTKKFYVTEVTSSTTLEINDAPGVVISSEVVSFIKRATCPTSIFTQDEAIFYKNGYFVTNTVQSIVPDINTAYPSKFVTFLTDEQIITSDDDSSLLDPALESSNYFATGADRLKVDLNLASLDLTQEPNAADLPLYIPLLKFVKGRIEYITEIEGLSELDKKLAERTYDESGSYVVTPFKITPIDAAPDSANITLSISAGKAYVGGYKVQTIDTTVITIPKPGTTETKTNFNINTTYGNYFRIANVRHSLPNPADLEAKNMFLELHNVTNPTNANSLVGTIAVKNIEFDTFIGTDQPQYKLFYHFYSPVREVPATWGAWSAKYNKPVAEGQYIANVLYTSANLLGLYGPARTPYFALFREPDTGGVAFWHTQWVLAKKDIANVKQQFALSFTNPNDPDYTRVRSNTKSFLVYENGSPFYDGLTNVKKIKSIVGVENDLTRYGLTATYASPSFYANIATNGLNTLDEAIIYDNNRPSDSLIYPITKSYVKTVDRIQTQYTKLVSGAIFINGVYTKSLSLPESFAIGDGILPSSTARNNFIVLIKSGATAGVPIGAWNFETGSVTIGSDASVATIDLGDPTFNGIADIAYVVENDDVQPRTKTLVSNFPVITDIKLADFKYSLNKSDIKSFGAIHLMSNIARYKGTWSDLTTYDYNDIVVYGQSAYYAILPSTSVNPSYNNAWASLSVEDPANYLLDNGQRDHFYDHGTISYIGSGVAPGNVLVTFDYYTHAGDGPVTVESYPADQYDKIPIYRSTVNAQEYQLRDCIDFRPRRVDNSFYQDYDPAIIPNSGITTEADVTYYVGRKDRIYVTNTLQNFTSPYDKFYVEIGKESISPTETIDGTDLTKLSIATITVPPYLTSAFEVKIEYDENKRFTMKDIAKIENLAYSLDKAVKLQSVEIANLKSIVTNDEGDALLKSGILVENFTDFDSADVTSDGFRCAIDTDEAECFPSFGAWNVDMVLQTENETDIFVFNDIITMKYEEELFVSNLKADSTLVVNPGGVNDGKGRADISKKNSFAVNLLLAGGLLLAGSVAYKTYQAVLAGSTVGAALKSAAVGTYLGGVEAFSTYSSLAAWKAESTLAAVWKVLLDAKTKLIDAFVAIDGVLQNVGWPYTTLREGFSWIYGKVAGIFGGGGISEVVPSSTSVLGAAGFASAELARSFGGSAFTLLTSGARDIGYAASQLFQGNFTVGLGSLSSGLAAFSGAFFTSAWAPIATAANFISTSFAGAGILGSAASWVGATFGATGSIATLALASPLFAVGAAIVATIVVSKVASAVWSGVKKVFSFFSDIRTKTNIKFKYKLPNGLKVYEFEYKKQFKRIAGHGKFEGFLAQQVRRKYPKAVKREKNGYLSVNYSLIGT